MKIIETKQIYSDKDFKYFSTHAQVPTPYITNNKVRMYFAARNKLGKSFITFADFKFENDNFVCVYSHKEPVLIQSDQGTFDEDGTMPSQILKYNDKLYLYYTGWNQKVSTPYHNAIGLAISNDDGYNFTRVSKGPLLDRNTDDPFIVVTPFIHKFDDKFVMFYSAGTRWVNVEGRIEPIYKIKLSFSIDGLTWVRDKSFLFNEHEYEAQVRPSLLKLKNKYLLSFCSRESHNFRDGVGSYRIRFAESNDGLTWSKYDFSFLDNVQLASWDQKMQCYPMFFNFMENHFMVYNGNSFGQTGFGIAKLEFNQDEI